jgi:hypothetical protein
MSSLGVGDVLLMPLGIGLWLLPGRDEHGSVWDPDGHPGPGGKTVFFRKVEGLSGDHPRVIEVVEYDPRGGSKEAGF